MINSSNFYLVISIPVYHAKMPYAIDAFMNSDNSDSCDVTSSLLLILFYHVTFGYHVQPADFLSYR